jgi:putative SOS response-associated peptidase YedK
LWDRWEGHHGDSVESCTIIKTTANALLKPVHDRMPVILPVDAYTTWLDPEEQKTEKLQSLLLPYPADEMMTVLVSTWVNNPRHEGPKCVEAVA